MYFWNVNNQCRISRTQFPRHISDSVLLARHGGDIFQVFKITVKDRLHNIQNWAARLIDGAMKYNQAALLLKKLHWLPIAMRVEFKNLLLTQRALNGQASDYFGHCVSRRQPVWSLRSREHSLLRVPRTTGHWGDRAFRFSCITLVIGLIELP